jgi:uncharacterized protein (DUF2126 family)
MLFVFIGLCAMTFVLAGTATANESSVTIIAPDNAALGSEITIELQASHSGNNFLHYTEWMYVEVNGKEIKRWEFSNCKRSQGTASALFPGTRSTTSTSSCPAPRICGTLQTLISQ